MPHNLRLIAVMALSMGLYGCSTVSSPSYKLEPPRAALMKAPEPLPSVSEGDDLYDAHARLRASYAREATRIMSLQKYVRTIRKQR